MSRGGPPLVDPPTPLAHFSFDEFAQIAREGVGREGARAASELENPDVGEAA
jgi:hypothetical protein